MALSARSVTTDPFQIHRFQVFDSQGFLNLSTPSGGFNIVSLPELNIDLGEYREGWWTYSRKYPIRPHFTQISLHKGVFLNDTPLYKLARSASEGQLYRTDVRIMQFHRTDVTGQINYIQATPSREIRCYNCVCTRYRPSTDFDAMASDIAVEEMDLEPESFRVFVNGQEVQI
jgi:phage tail-like protein